jgi:hypothetical protein
MPNDNNGIINRPFADLQERLAEVETLDRDNALNNRREVDYRGIIVVSLTFLVVKFFILLFLLLMLK